MCLFDTIAANPAHFPVTVDAQRPVEVWGKPVGEYTAVIGKVFNAIMEEGGFSPRAVLAYADRKGLLDKDQDQYKKSSVSTEKTSGAPSFGTLKKK